MESSEEKQIKKAFKVLIFFLFLGIIAVCLLAYLLS